MEKKELLTRTYKIELTGNELEFITHTLYGVIEFLQWLHGDQDTIFDLHQPHGPGIDPGKVSDKIYHQYHDDSGKLLEPEASK